MRMLTSHDLSWPPEIVELAQNLILLTKYILLLGNKDIYIWFIGKKLIYIIIIGRWVGRVAMTGPILPH